MSWLFSQALVVEFSAVTCLDGALSVPSNSIPMQQAYLSPDKMTEFSRLSRFGMTFAPLTDDLGADVLTSFLAAFPARISALPAKALASTESEAAYGLKWHGSFARYDLDTFTWKTPQCSLLEGLDEFSETWPRWGSMRNGVSCLRPTPALRICESASGLWQTPVADDAVNRAKGKWNSRGEPKLSAQVLKWSTPRARDVQPEGLEVGLGRVEKYSTCSLSTAVNADESPRTSGLLNPTWVEWLMGWPLGWTALEPLGTGKFQEWLQQHSPSFPMEPVKVAA